ncbi:MAG: PHP domain-containing protein [Bacillota bacterium]
MIDLHCHTNVSDNSLSIPEVIQEARAKGITHLAITDHDTTLGLQQAMEIGSRAGVEIIPGIEISAFDYERKVRAHILGYFVQPGHPALKELCEPLAAARHAVSRRMVNILHDHGYLISWEQVSQLAGLTGVFKQHIMHALMKAGYCDGIYGSLYEKLFAGGGSCKKQGLAHIPLTYADAVAAIKAIRAAGGVPVLAHPGLCNNFTAIPGWVEAGLAGIEAVHPKHDETATQLAWLLARNFNLVVTGGSDYHGFYGDTGCGLGIESLTVESIRLLQQRKETISL